MGCDSARVKIKRWIEEENQNFRNGEKENGWINFNLNLIAVSLITAIATITLTTGTQKIGRIGRVKKN